VPLAGTYEAENVATAVTAVEALRERGVPLEAACVRRGLSRVDWPGRFQVLARNPLLILDGAHNPASMSRLAESIEQVAVARDLVFLLGFSADKDIRGSAAALSRLGGRIIVTRSQQPRAAEPRDIAMKLSGLGLKLWCEPDVARGLWRARAMARRDGTVCVAGSLYLVAEVLRLWRTQPSLSTLWPDGSEDRASSPGRDG